MGDKLKGFLYGWLGKQRVTPHYEVKSVGTKVKPKFESELTVKSYDFVGIGSGQTKKEAQLQAATRFLSFLLDYGYLEEEELPEPLPGSSCGDDESEYSSYSEKSCDAKAADEDSRNPREGYWNIRNAKAGVNQFMQQKRIDQNYRYSCIEGDDSRYFVAELDIPVGHGTVMRGRGEGASKQEASRVCALYIIRTLYHKGLIDAYKQPQAQEAKEVVPVCEVSLSSTLEDEVIKVIDKLDLEVARKPNSSESFSLIISDDHNITTGVKRERDNVVSWMPPTPKLNPWSQNSGCSDNAQSAHTTSHVGVEEEYGELESSKTPMILEASQILPIFESKEIITYASENNSVVIVRGVPGSGKSTQVPQYILDSYIKSKRGKQCSIMVVEPHDVNAVLAAETVAKEREEQIGETCGYMTSFEIALPRTFQAITYCTAGSLLQLMEAGLKGISHIIVDEIHERNLYVDVLLTILRDMTAVYPKLHIILMTAAVDTQPFSVYFNNCPVVEVICRSYAVHEYFLEDCIEFLNFTPKQVATKKKEKNKFIFFDENSENLNKVIGPEYAAATRISMALLNEMEVPYELIEALLVYIHNLNIAGSVLVFLPGLHAVFTFMTQMKENPNFDSKSYVFYSLHQLMSSADLQKASEPVTKGTTKVILTTSVAESCVSISDVVFVINSCKTKMELNHGGRKIYATVWITKANVEQRQERAGLIRPGFCFHLCSRARYQNLRSNSVQIQIVPIQGVSLKLRLLGTTDVSGFYSKMMDPPTEEAIARAENLLTALEALDKNGHFTSIGKILASLPVDPQLGKMIVLGCMFGLGDAMCTVAAQCCIFADPFVSTDVKKKYGYHQYSDQIALLNAVQDWEKIVCLEEEEKHFCEKHDLVHLSLYCIWLVKEQVKNSLRLAGLSEQSIIPKVLRFDSPDSNLDVVVALMCIGFYPNICVQKEKHLVLTSDKILAQINSFSVNCCYQSNYFPFPFLVYAEQVATFSLNCKHTTVVTPVHLLLFGSRTVEYVNGVILVDGVWQLQMPFETAANLVAVRKGLNDLLTYYVTESAKVETLRSNIEALLLFETSLFEGDVSITEEGRLLINLVKQLCVRHLLGHVSRNRHGKPATVSVSCNLVVANPKTQQSWHHCPTPFRLPRSQHGHGSSY